MKEKFGVEVPAHILYGHNAQLSDVVKFLQSRSSPTASSSASGAIDWEAEISLPDDIQPAERTSSVPEPTPKRVLLSGATGFLGAFLLAELLDQLPDAKVLLLLHSAQELTTLMFLLGVLHGTSK